AVNNNDIYGSKLLSGTMDRTLAICGAPGIGIPHQPHFRHIHFHELIHNIPMSLWLTYYKGRLGISNPSIIKSLKPHFNQFYLNMIKGTIVLTIHSCLPGKSLHKSTSSLSTLRLCMRIAEGKFIF